MDNNDCCMHQREGYSHPAPYPEIRVTAPNKCYASLLMDDYSGMVSEFTAINQYLYHSFQCGDINEDLHKLFENVAINEMLHMEILADLIKQLGGNPLFKGCSSTKGEYWNGRFVYYGCNLYDRLNANIDSEHKAIRNYEDHIEKINDPYIQAILKRIILDEMVHIELFKNAVKKYCRL